MSENDVDFSSLGELLNSAEEFVFILGGDSGDIFELVDIVDEDDVDDFLATIFLKMKRIIVNKITKWENQEEKKGQISAPGFAKPVFKLKIYLNEFWGFKIVAW